MEQNQISSSSIGRITVIDALRGFALLGVIIIHMSQHFAIFSFTGIDHREPFLSQLDEAISWFTRNIIMGKFINIFAFLFGMSFFIQMDSAARKGIDFRKRFIWRMIVLFLIGLIGNSFFSGDILSIYAAFGVLMVIMFPLKNWMLITIATLLIIGTPRITTTLINNHTKTEQVEQRGSTTQRSSSNISNNEKPSYWRSAKQNLTTGYIGKLNYQFGTNGRGYLTFALFILGLVVGRLRFFEQISSKKRRNTTLFLVLSSVGVVLTIISNLLPEIPRAIIFGSGSDISPLTHLTFTIRDISSVIFSGAIVLGFILLYQIKSVGKYLDILSPYGRMGLTNYVMQSIIGSLIFSMWAFGATFGGFGATELFIVGIIIYSAQVLTSKIWLKYYMYGPLEWLWRSATYFKLQPLRKK